MKIKKILEKRLLRNSVKLPIWLCAKRTECDILSYFKQYQRLRSILEEDALTENVLTADEAGKCLTRIGQVGCGLLYAYIQIDVDHR